MSFGYDLKFQESLSHVDDDEESLLGHHRETGDGMPVTLVSAFLGPSSGDRRVSRFRSTALMSDIWRDKRTEDAAQVYDMSYLSVSLAWNKRRSRRWKMLKAGVLWGFVSNVEGSTGDFVEVECNGIAILKRLSGIPCLSSGVMGVEGRAIDQGVGRWDDEAHRIPSPRRKSKVMNRYEATCHR